MEMIVTRAGFLTSVQYLGRTGFREFGVSTSGALDPFALRVANLLVGNDEGAAGLEITLGGLHLRFDDERMIAWCGGEFDVQIGSRDGDQLLLGEFRRSQTAATAGISSWTAPHDWARPATRNPILRFARGADSNRFNASTLQRL